METAANYLSSLPKPIQKAVECASGWLYNGQPDASIHQCPRGFDKGVFMEMAKTHERLRNYELNQQMELLMEEQEEAGKYKEEMDRQSKLVYDL